MKAQGKITAGLSFAIAITAVNVILVWSFRFLPVGYPVWLYEAHVLREFSNTMLPISSTYEVVFGPIPNLTFTVCSWLLGYVMPIEAAGKFFLTFCLIGFPWGVWYTIRALAPGTENPLQFVAFPFAFNWLFFLSHNCLFGLLFLVWMVGYFFPRLGEMKAPGWIILAILFLVQYFSHGITFSIALVTFWGGAMYSGSGGTRLLKKVLLAQLPSLVILVWYVLTSASLLKTSTVWGIRTVLQNAAKPLMLFLKTYGVSSPFLPSVLNSVWLLALLLLVVVLLKAVRASGTLNKRFLMPAIFCAAMVLFLPDPAFGVDQPGVRFGLPLFVLLIFMLSAARIGRAWVPVFFVVASVVAAYNWFYFKRVDEQATALYADLVSEVDLKKPIYTIALDWPAGYSLWDRVSPSSNALSGILFYALIDSGGVAELPETGPVRMRPPVRATYPQPEGREADRWLASTFARPDRLRSFRYVAVFGTGPVVDKAVVSLQQLNFRVAKRQRVWTILVSG